MSRFIPDHAGEDFSRRVSIRELCKPLDLLRGPGAFSQFLPNRLKPPLSESVVREFHELSNST
jgi:hypothetical protein